MSHAYNDYSTSAYGKMIEDQRRTGPFVHALRAAIGPQTVFLDIGTGTGIFSFLACQFGAARVYAVEADAIALQVAQQCARDIPGSERITWIQGLTTELDLPEQADLVVGDLHGTLPFFKGNIESLADARKRHLKPGGRLLPSRDVLHAAPAFAPEEYVRIESPWRHNDYGIDLSAATPYVVNQWSRARSEPIAPERFLAPPQVWGVVDYNTAETPGLDHTMDWQIERDGTLHGLYVWFDGDLGEGFGYSNSPLLPELVYGRAFFPFEHPTTVAPGDTVRTRLAGRLVKGSYLFRWDTLITGADGTAKARFEQSTFKAQPINPAELRKASADYVPVLNQDGQITQAVLQAMAAGQRLQEIADALATRFPQRFKTPAQALDQVSRLSQKYG